METSAIPTTATDCQDLYPDTDETFDELMRDWLATVPRRDWITLCLCVFQICRREFNLAVVETDETTAELRSKKHRRHGDGDRTSSLTKTFLNSDEVSLNMLNQSFVCAYRLLQKSMTVRASF